MTKLSAGVRERRRAVGVGESIRSVREVCLLGGSPPTEAWEPGGRVEWAGRTYRVAATQPRNGSGEDHSPCYVHLTTEEPDAIPAH